MSDYSDSDDPDYGSVEEREKKIRLAMEMAKGHLQVHIQPSNPNSIWQYINQMETPEDSRNVEDWKWVILALKEFCKEATNPKYRDDLTKDIVNSLVSSSLETQYQLQEFIDKEILISLFWTSLIATLKKTYEEFHEEEEITSDTYRHDAGRSGPIRVSCPIFRF